MSRYASKVYFVWHDKIKVIEVPPTINYAQNSEENIFFPLPRFIAPVLCLFSVKTGPKGAECISGSSPSMLSLVSPVPK